MSPKRYPLFQYASKGLIRFIVILPVLCFAAKGWAGPKPLIRVGIFDNIPISFIDENDRVTGIYPEIINRVAQKENWQIKYVVDTWAGCLEKLKKNQIDLMTGIGFTRERSRWFDFSKEPVITGWGQIFTADNNTVKSILDLDKKKVTVLRNDNHGRNFIALSKAFHISPVIVESLDYKELCSRIVNKEVDAGVLNNITGSFLKRQFPIHPTPVLLNPGSAVFAVSKGRNFFVIEKIDQWLKIWKADENSPYYAILNRWYGDTAPTAGFPMRIIIAALIGAATLIVLTLTWTTLLKREVRRRTRDLKESEERFRQLAENIREIFWIALPDLSRLTYLSPKFKEMTHRPLEKLASKPSRLLDHIHPEDRERVAGYFKGRILETIDEEYRVIYPDGSIKWWRNRAFPVRTKKEEIHRIVGVADDITERKQIEEALLRSRQKLSLHIQQTPMAVIELDLDFMIRSWNPAAEKIFGHPEKEILGRHISVIVPKKDFKHIESVFNALIQNKGGTRNVNRNVKKDGSVIFCEWFNTPVVDDSGQIIAFICLGQDISERLKTEKALKENEERYRELFGNMTSGVAVYTTEDNGNTFRFKDLNRSAEIITDVKQEDVLGRDVTQIYPGLADTGIIQAFQDAFKTGETIHIPAVRYTDERISLWVEQHIYKLPSGEIVSVFHDISEKKQAQTKIQIERDKLHSVVNGIGDHLYIVDQHYTVSFQNDLSRQHFGDLTGKKCHRLLFGFESPCPFCRLPDCLQQNTVIRLETGPVNRKVYELAFSPFQYTNEKINVVVLMQDITEKKYLQAEAMRAGHLASLGELAAGVAHEINNPVTGIISLAEILSDKFEKLGGDKSLPARIIDEGERIGKIVRNLLAFARIKKDEHSPVNIEDIIQKTLELVEKQIFKDNIRLETNFLPDAPPIKANDQEIQQVFLNLISNARYAINKKGTDPSSEKIIRISTQLFHRDGKPFIRTTFFDTGTGIPKDLIPLITDPFFSTKPQGEGTGLGLSISHGIINNHGGRIRFDTQEGEYTNVSIDLPILQETGNER